MTLPVRSGRDAGFTLLETLGAIALMGVVLWSLSIISSQWLHSWRSSHDRLQRIEAIMMALDRIAVDIGEADFIRAGNGSKLVVFEGHSSEVTFVRTAIGPNAKGGLELVRIGESMTARDEVVARSRVAFVPGMLEVDPASSPVVLLRRPFRLSFEFTGSDGIWRTDWQGEEKLPWAVRVTILDGSGRRKIARVAAIHARLPAPDGCGGRSTCGADQVPDRVASANHPDGEPPTLEQVTRGELSE
jgi:general secretion pathway protein J